MFGLRVPIQGIQVGSSLEVSAYLPRRVIRVSRPSGYGKGACRTASGHISYSGRLAASASSKSISESIGVKLGLNCFVIHTCPLATVPSGSHMAQRGASPSLYERAAREAACRVASGAKVGVLREVAGQRAGLRGPFPPERSWR